MTASERIFDHILIVMFENQYRGYVLENDYFKALAQEGINLGASFGVMHPSQTNYISSIAGELCNVTDDDRPPVLPQRTIVDLVEEAGLGWKAYMDSYAPTPLPAVGPPIPQDNFPYVIKHNPFSSFGNIVGSGERWSRVVSESQFFTDVANDALPEYSWFTPDMWNDGHYLRGTEKPWPDDGPPNRAPGLVDQAAEWLEWFFGALKFPGPHSALPDRTLVVVTFDEADYEKEWDKDDKYTYDGPNQVYTVLLADGIAPGTIIEEEGYNHYSVLRTVEENFGLASLEKNDADSNWLRFLWGDHFVWGDAEATPIPADAPVAAAGSGDDVVVVAADSTGAVSAWTLSNDTWSAAVATGCTTTDALGLARTNDSYVMISQDSEGRLVESTSADGITWSAAGPPIGGEMGASTFAVSECNRGVDVMVCFEAGGRIHSVRRTSAGWGAVVDTGHQTDGPLALCALGHTLLLIFVEPGDTLLRAVSYTTADFNTTTIAPSKYGGTYDDAVADTWCPTAVPVAHFAAVTTLVTPDELEPLLQPYRAGGQMVMAELDGVVHLVYPSGEDPKTPVEARYSIAGVLTPKKPISYRAGDKNTSNGYGTLAEAGWTYELPFNAVGDQGMVAGASNEGAAVIFGRPEAGETLTMVQGSYQRST